MSPDKKHEQSSRETLKLLNALEDKLEKKIDDNHKESMNGIGERVKFTTFTWVLSLMMVVIVGILGLIYDGQRGLDEKLSETNSSVSYIEGKLTNAEITSE